MRKYIRILLQKTSRKFALCCCTVIIMSSHCESRAQGQVSITSITPRYTLSQTRPFKDSLVLTGDEEYLFLMGCLYNEHYPKFSDGECNTYELEIPYLLILANRYNNPSACYRIYSRTKNLYERYHLELDQGTIDFILYYLCMGANSCMSGSDSCIAELYKLYMTGKYVEKDIEKANYYKQRYEEIFQHPFPKYHLIDD